MKADASVAELSSAINRTAFPTWETHEAMRALQLPFLLAVNPSQLDGVN